MKVGELFVDLFIKTDDRTLKDFIRDLGELRMSSLLNTLGLAEMFEGMRKIMEIGDRAAHTINNFSAQTGQSSKKFQQWSKFAEQFGLDAQVIGQSIETLQDNIMGLKLTGQGANAYNMLGLDPRGFKDYFQLLSAIREKMKGMPIESQRFLLQQLGLSKELVQLFNVADGEWASISKNMAVSEENLAMMREYHKNINKLSQDWNTFITHLAALLAPVAEVFIVILDTIVQILDNFAGWIGPLLTVAGIVAKIAGFFNPIVRAITLLGGALTLGNALGQAGAFNPAMEPSRSNFGGGNRVNHNKVSFHITGNNPEEIGRVVDKKMQDYLSDAEYQTPLQNN